jgi:hypothetical protein|tara:strand:- start:30 stop:278 length:249 start_codon:yes stop_codon:yes gene_type:complete
MTEQDIKDLGFEIHRETKYSSGMDHDWHYYTLDIGDICLITNSNNEAVKEGWGVSIFDFPSCAIKGIGDLEDLIKIIKNNTI